MKLTPCREAIPASASYPMQIRAWRISFGLACTNRIVTQKDAMKAVNGAHLSGHGGTNDGIIGAAAAVGLTTYGWSGRFIEFGGLRDFPPVLSVGTLEEAGIGVISLDRDARGACPR